MSKNKKAIRQGFRDAVFYRDKNSCRVCGASGKPLDAHHIINRNEMPNGGYAASNGISLCPECHISAETYYFGSFAQKVLFADFSPDKLFKLINFSYTKALCDSEKLK